MITPVSPDASIAAPAAIAVLSQSDMRSDIVAAAPDSKPPESDRWLYHGRVLKRQ
ncbi:MAG: hypothetical protein QOG56_2269, partial [Solirubrobacteraceae bacterium]|nr:hypothetical protein [Solirubrobacteraceae bacterium]